MSHNVRVVKVYDIRPVDLDTGKRLAIPKHEYKKCDCCGKPIAIINELSNGHFIGSDCATILPHTKMGQNPAKAFGLSKKQEAYFISLQS